VKDTNLVNFNAFTITVHKLTASCNITTAALNYLLIIHTHEAEWGTQHWFYRIKDSVLEEERRCVCVCAPVNVKTREK
jgi:hypothetical protein